MKFYCETDAHIPLPPEYTFPQAFNYLNPDTNSFYILEDDECGYVQCGGSKKCCTVEYRENKSDGSFSHYRIAKGDDRSGKTKIPMTNGGVTVRDDEVLTHNDAIEIFKCFFDTKSIPEKYRLHVMDDNYVS